MEEKKRSNVSEECATSILVQVILKMQPIVSTWTLVRICQTSLCHTPWQTHNFEYASYICVVPVIDLGASVGDQRYGPAALPSTKRHGIRCTGGRMGSRVGLDGCGKSRHYPD